MRVLGIDCGTERTGYGVIDSDGAHHLLMEAGVIRTNPKQSLEVRLLEIANALRQVIDKNDPECAAVEEVFHAVNVRTALKLAHVRGVALLVIAEAGVPLGEYSPMEIKTSVVGYGRAEKHQVRMMVNELVRTAKPIESDDAADAVAVAICHATRQRLAHQLGAAV
jgi:crossover junction endodeoxyribonuclease RuvC